MPNNDEFPRAECVNAVRIAVQQEIKPLKDNFNEMHKPMFVDNGKKSIQTSLSALNGHVKFQWFVLGVLIAGIAGTAFWIIRMGLT